ncbi:vWA domain-containing protein [Flavobacterium sp.]|uniref:vWA domain-containing protein n=4 Tax=Flavobacterium sp. TaxID=239 RepID=UPI0040485C6B
MKKHQVHNLIILDESGSMNSIKKTILNGFNELINSVKSIEIEFPEQEHYISLISFNSNKNNNVIHFTEPVSKIETIDYKNYNPESSTPLFDAMGFSILKLKNFLRDKNNYSVLVTILTDGEENASREYSLTSIKRIIEELKSENWTFTYIGTDHDIDKTTMDLNINNKIRFDKNGRGIKNMFEIETNSRIKYSLAIREGKLISDDDYYK